MIKKIREFEKQYNEVAKVKTLTKLKKIFDNMTIITPSLLENFFDWYYHDKKRFCSYDEKTQSVKVYNHRLIKTVNFVYETKGSTVEFMVNDLNNKERKTYIIINILPTGFTIISKSTYSNFEKEYNCRFYESSTISKKDYCELFCILRDFMSFCILYKASYIVEEKQNSTKEDIYEAIPMRIFA